MYQICLDFGWFNKSRGYNPTVAKKNIWLCHLNDVDIFQKNNWKKSQAKNVLSFLLSAHFPKQIALYDVIIPVCSFVEKDRFVY